MSLRRKLILLIGTIGCAIAFMLPTPTPGLGSIESAAPQYDASLRNAELLMEGEVRMAALRQQARLALVQLQTRVDVSR